MENQKAKGLNWVLLPLGLVLIFVCVRWYSETFYHPWPRMIPCIGHVKYLTTSLMIYQADHDDQCPPGHWQTALTPYVKNKAIFTCTEFQKAGLRNGYAMNEFIAGKSSAAIPHPQTTVAIFETANPMGNRFAPVSEIVYRDHEGHKLRIVSYMDNHVKTTPKP